MKSASQMSVLVLAIVLATILTTIVLSPAFANSVEPAKSTQALMARPPHQDPTPTPPPPPDDGGNIFQNITQLINFPFVNLVEALQNAIEEILHRAMEPIQMMFEAVLSLWLKNPGILSSGNAALPGWDLMKDAWQFMYSIAIAFWPLTLAVVAAIAAKDAVAAATWGLGDLKTALGTWFGAVLLSATSLWWMDLANNLANAITSYILYNFAGPQFFPGTFMIFFTVVLPGLFLTFPLAGIIIIIFLVILAITIFVGLTFAIIARLVLMYLLVALGPLAIILGVLPPLRFVTQMWVRGLLLVLVLGPVDALLLKLAFNVAQYASSAPPLQAVAAFIGVFGLLSILITINFTLVKTVFGAVIAVAHQTIGAVQAVAQMVVAGALLMTGAGAGAGVAIGGNAVGGAATGGGGGGVSGSGGALGGGQSIASGNSSGGMATPSRMPGMGSINGAGSGNGNPPWHPSGRGMTAAGGYLQSTRGPLAGFGALLRAAGVDQMQRERGGMMGKAGNGIGSTASLEKVEGALNEQESPERETRDTRQLPQDESAIGTGASGRGSRAADQVARTPQVRAGSEMNRGAVTTHALAPHADATGRESNVLATMQESTAPRSQTQATRSVGGNDLGLQSESSPSAHAVSVTNPPQRKARSVGSTQSSGSGTSGGSVGATTNAPPRRANIDAIQESRAAMGYDSGGSPDTVPDRIAGASAIETATSDSDRETANENAPSQSGSNAQQVESANTVGEENKGPLGNAYLERMNDERGNTLIGETTNGSSNNEDGYAATPMPALTPEADRTLSMLPENSDDAREQAAQLISHYPNAEAQARTAMALEHAMQTVHKRNGVEWSHMGGAMERGLWSTHEAANNHISLNDMARQMEPFTGSRNPSDYLAWQIAGHGEQFQLPSQQVAYLPAAGPYEYQGGRYIEQQLGQAIGYQDAAKMLYVIRDPSTPGGGWNKAQEFIQEVNRISRSKVDDPIMELDRWMQANAPTRARVLWNMRFNVVDGK